jgi:hypothetical protein
VAGRIAGVVGGLDAMCLGYPDMFSKAGQVNKQPTRKSECGTSYSCRKCRPPRNHLVPSNYSMLQMLPLAWATCRGNKGRKWALTSASLSQHAGPREQSFAWPPTVRRQGMLMPCRSWLGNPIPISQPLISLACQCMHAPHSARLYHALQRELRQGGLNTCSITLKHIL